jgi:hypothetical protein
MNAVNVASTSERLIAPVFGERGRKAWRSSLRESAMTTRNIFSARCADLFDLFTDSIEQLRVGRATFHAGVVTPTTSVRRRCLRTT